MRFLTQKPVIFMNISVQTDPKNRLSARELLVYNSSFLHIDKQDVNTIEKINLNFVFTFCVTFRNILSSRCMKIRILIYHLTSMMQDLHLQLSKFYLVS